jgi:DNA-binding HxlR family transcriptional regulator
MRPVSAATFAALTAAWQTTEEIRKRIGVQNVRATALSNRLAALVRDGVVDRRFSPANFRMVEYRRAPASPNGRTR